MILSSLRTPLTVQGDTLGSPLTISLPSLGRPVALRYRCGEKAGSIAGPGRLTRVEWVPLLTLAEEYPDRDQIPLKLILDAYENGKIGDSRETQVLLSIPEAVLPTVTLRVLPESGERFLQGGQALVEATVSGSLGEELTSCTLSGGGRTGRAEAANAEDALPLGQADGRFLGLRKLWENPSPEQEFPAQTVAAAGALLLIEAAVQAGSTQRVWELAGSAGAIRVLSGSTLAVRTLRQTEAGLEFAAAAPADTWAVPLAVYALKGGSIG